MSQQRILPVVNPAGDVKAILEQTTVGNERGEALNIFRTLAHHPSLLRRFNGLGGAFMRHGQLEPSLRELVILRVAWLSSCDYEWGQHVVIAARCDVSPGQIEAVKLPSSAAWDARQAAALEAVDALITACDIDDDLWARLETEFSEAESLELLMLIGFYRMTAGVLNAARVTREEWLPGLDEERA